MSQLVFTADGNLTEEATLVCIQLTINPETIKAKTLDNFKATIKDEAIAQIRHKHYMQKRRHKVRKIIEAIKRGDHLQEPIVVIKDDKGGLQHHYATAGDAYRSKSVSQVKNSTIFGGDSHRRVDIPLREPLDEDFRLNRKLAKQIYEKERLEKVA